MPSTEQNKYVSNTAQEDAVVLNVNYDHVFIFVRKKNTCPNK